MMKKSMNGDNATVTVRKDFLDKLGEMHTAERELTAALPLIIAAARSADLKALLHIHLKETQGHVKTLEKIARDLGCRLPLKTCPPMTRLIAEGVAVIGKRVISSEQDRALIAVGRKIEQFEIQAYQELCATTQDEGLTHEFAALKSTLNQEELADELLDQLAQGKGPLKTLVENASLKRVGARRAS